MRKTRPKYKVRRQRGRNAIRRRWTRTERSNKKWKVKKTVRRVRTGRKVKRRVTGRNERTNDARLGGGEVPRRGKLKKWLKTKRRGRKSAKRRYGSGQSVSTKRRGERVRKQQKKNIKAYRTREEWYMKGRKGVKGQRDRNGRRRDEAGRGTRMREEIQKPMPHVRRGRERRVEIRRWRTGRAHTRGEARRRREKGRVRKRGEREPRKDGKRQRKVGEMRQVDEEYWSVRKEERRKRQFGAEVKQRNGRAGRPYVRVDYRTGRRRVHRRPRTGEVGRPARIERGRWIMTK